MSTLGRYILGSLLWNYAITLCVMLSLYVLLDMFVNMDEFTEQGAPVLTVFSNIVSYYAPNLLLYFKQLSGTITTFACLATAARMRSQNELTAMLASGVSLYRLAIPVVGFGLASTSLLVATTEWLIPSVAPRLARDHDDVDGRRTFSVLFLPENDGSLLSASRFHPKTKQLENLLVLTRDEQGSIVETLEADRASWEPAVEGSHAGRWVLERGRLRVRSSRSEAGLGPSGEVVESFPQYYESKLGPDEIELRQREGWIEFLSLAQLNRYEARDDKEAGVVFHAKQSRVTAPILGMVLLLLGLPFFLDRSPSAVLSETGKCMLLTGSCYVAAFIAQSIRMTGDSGIVAWIPLFVFATVAMVRVDRIRT